MTITNKALQLMTTPEALRGIINSTNAPRRTFFTSDDPANEMMNAYGEELLERLFLAKALPKTNEELKRLREQRKQFNMELMDLELKAEYYLDQFVSTKKELLRLKEEQFWNTPASEQD